jgi:hypothetical protein
MIRWLRVVWPPWWTLLTAGLLHLTLEGLHLFQEQSVGRPYFQHPEKEVPIGLAILMAILYAGYRVWVFHPARPGYCEWLGGTPWTVAKPLPLGPLHLVWQDVLLIGIVLAVNWPRLQLQTFLIAQWFLVLYVVALSVMNHYTGERAWAYAGGFGVGFMTFFVRDPIHFCLAAAATYAFALLGLRASLARGPWDEALNRDKLDQIVGNRGCGWPHDWVGPRFPYAVEMPLRDVLALGLLAGWWLFILNYAYRREPGFFIGFLITFIFLGAATATRLCIYCNGYWPPISFWARLVTFRWIIPGYDKVFAAPLLAILVGIGMSTALLAVGPRGLSREASLEELLITPITLTLTIWILFGMGPSVRNWRLTGTHRIAPIFQAKTYTR